MGTSTFHTVSRAFDYSKCPETLASHRMYWATTMIHDLKARLLLFLRQHPENLEVLAPSALEQTVRCLRPLHAKHGQALGLPPDPLPACFERTARHLLEASDAHRFDIAPTAGAVMTLHQALCAEEPLDGPSPDDAFFPPETVERLPKPARLGARTTQLRGLCEVWEHAVGDGRLDPLLILGPFVVDLYNLGVFDRNRELTCLLVGVHLLNRANHRIARYISVPSLVEHTYPQMVKAMRASSHGWETGRNDYRPFTEYLLEILVESYLRFYQVYLIADGKPPTNVDRVNMIVTQRSYGTTKQDIVRSCPLMSETTIERALATLVKEGGILKRGGGRYTYYLPAENHYGNVPGLIDRLDHPIF